MKIVLLICYQESSSQLAMGATFGPEAPAEQVLPKLICVSGSRSINASHIEPTHLSLSIVRKEEHTMLYKTLISTVSSLVFLFVRWVGGGESASLLILTESKRSYLDSISGSVLHRTCLTGLHMI